MLSLLCLILRNVLDDLCLVKCFGFSLNVINLGYVLFLCRYLEVFYLFFF